MVWGVCPAVWGVGLVLYFLRGSVSFCLVAAWGLFTVFVVWVWRWGFGGLLVSALLRGLWVWLFVVVGVLGLLGV